MRAIRIVGQVITHAVSATHGASMQFYGHARTVCGVRVERNELVDDPLLTGPVDCMTCLVRASRRT